LVLPRVLGRFPNVENLNFFSSQDRDRIVSAALEVANVTVSRYVLPSAYPSSKALLEKKDVTRHSRIARKAAEKKLGQPSLAADVVIEPSIADANLFLEDWVQQTPSDATSQGVSGYPNQALSPAGGMSSPGVPRSSSPALSVLADVLSAEGDIFNSIVSVLEYANRIEEDGLSADAVSLTFAVFNATPPTFRSAKAGATNSRLARQSLLQPLRTSPTKSSYYGAIRWKERAIIQALNLLCAALAREEGLQATVDFFPGKKNKIIPVLQFRDKTTSSRLKVLSLQLSKLSQRLLSSNVDSRVLSYIMELIGYSAISDKHDVEIARAAAAVITYVDQSLSRQQNIAAHLSRSGEDGERSISIAFADRLVASTRRLDSRPDVELVSLILNRLLFQLRAREPAGACLAFSLLGLSVSSCRNGRVGCYGGVGEPKDCFDALLLILSSGQFVTSSLSSELAANGIEVFFRLLSLAGVDEASRHRVLYAAERLRAVDFWTARLSKIISTIFVSNYDILDDAQIVHSLAWLAKGVAIELQLLGGSSFGPPQPTQYRRLISFLFEAPDDILTRLTQLAPIEKKEFICIAPPPQKAIRASYIQLRGSPEIIQGYEVIDTALLVDLSDRSEDIDAMKSWAEEWNDSCARECGASHLSDAIHLVLGASAMSNLQEGLIGGVKVLAAILDKMMPGSDRNVDELYFSTATRNLARSALVATKIAVAEAEAAYINPSATADIDIPAACVRLARSIALSEPSGRSFGAEEECQNERTAMLFTAFSLLLKYASDLAVESEYHRFVAASNVLMRFAKRYDIARSCLALLLDVFENNVWGQQTREYSFVQDVLLAPSGRAGGSTNAVALIELITNLEDLSAADLLQRIAMVPGGALALLNSTPGILQRLRFASSKYLTEESKVLASQNNISSFQDVSIEVPHFLGGHVRLMSVLLTAEAPEDRLHTVALEVIGILGSYNNVLERLFARFPAQGELIHSVARCMMGAEMLLSSTSLGTTIPKPGFGSFEKRFAALTMHLAEYPLPNRVLAPLPASLAENRTTVVSIAVAVSNTNDKTWWDHQDIKITPISSGGSAFPAAQQLSDDTYAYAIAGADILRSGLYLFRDRSSGASVDIDSRQLARAFCRCTDAMGVRYPINPKLRLAPVIYLFACMTNVTASHISPILLIPGD